MCALLGSWPPVALVVGGGLAGAGIWGQIVEGGRHGLSRPFGYYGSLLGGLLGCGLATQLFHIGLTEILAVGALACPLVQGVGRLRCVVQGCCHGHTTTLNVGIRVTHAKSRVVAVSGLHSTPIHATPVYSMLANLLIAGILWRLWYDGAAAPLLVGLYFILSGVARFVEEAYRGEVQTPVVGRLKLYQWLALASTLVGIAATLLPPVTLSPQLHTHPAYLTLAIITGLLAAFALGVDFPFSNRRFSRLAT
jgi:prolipoprotein diacylglyceryltransferase